MLIQAALNGDRTKSVHPGIPLTLSELITDAISCRAAGAQSFHVHPHTVQGHESLEPDVVNQVAGNLKAATGVPVGVTTGEWIEPDVDKRIAMIREWTEPDYASVNICEDGSIGIMSALLEAGIGIEAGVWTAEDAKLLGESGLGNQVTRVLVEPGELTGWSQSCSGHRTGGRDSPGTGPARNHCASAATCGRGGDMGCAGGCISKGDRYPDRLRRHASAARRSIGD